MKQPIKLILGGALLVALPLFLTSCEDILGEWSRPAPYPVAPTVAVTSITLKSETTIDKGSSETLAVSVAPDNATDKTVIWSSSDETIATVTDGVVTAIAVGTATITATANDGSDIKATCVVTVKFPGLLAGKFSVSATQKVGFSQGNLKYTKSTNTWSFMDHQWSTVETPGQNVGTDYADQDVVSLFCWSTSGYEHGAICYQPYSTTSGTANYYAYNDNSKNLYDETGKADWGYNKISNGGNTENSGWRTLKIEEWEYLFSGRTSVAIRYCKAIVNSVYGAVLFPDSYTHPLATAINSENTATANYETNTWSLDEWTKMEEAGCVFLPAANNRSGVSVFDHTSIDPNDKPFCSYWTSSKHTNVYRAYNVWITNDNMNNTNGQETTIGHSVRLARNVE